MDSEQLANLNDIIKSGLRNSICRQFCRANEFSIIELPAARGTCSLSVTKATTTRPDDFRWLCVGPLLFRLCVIDAPLKETGIGILLGYRSTSTSSVPLAAQPTQFAVHAQPTEGTTPQRLTISLSDPGSKLRADRSVRNRVLYNLAADAAYPMGGQPTPKPLSNLCLAAAERMMDDQSVYITLSSCCASSFLDLL